MDVFQNVGISSRIAMRKKPNLEDRWAFLEPDRIESRAILGVRWKGVSYISTYILYLLEVAKIS